MDDARCLAERFEVAEAELVPRAKAQGAKAASVASEAVLLQTLLEGKIDAAAKRARINKELRVLSQHSELFGRDVNALVHPRLMSEALAALLKSTQR